jgi:hypothetical protein
MRMVEAADDVIVRLGRVSTATRQAIHMLDAPEQNPDAVAQAEDALTGADAAIDELRDQIMRLHLVLGDRVSGRLIASVLHGLA